MTRLLQRGEALPGAPAVQSRDRQRPHRRTAAADRRRWWLCQPRQSRRRQGPGDCRRRLPQEVRHRHYRDGQEPLGLPFATLADIVGTLAKAEREGQLRERIRWFCRASLLIVDEIGYLPVVHGGSNLFFQLVNARYEKGAMILTSNRGFAE